MMYYHNIAMSDWLEDKKDIAYNRLVLRNEELVRGLFCAEPIEL